MKLRIGLIFGFAVGYYFGAMAGRERYLQLNRWLRRVRRSDAFETAVDKTKAVVDLGVERAKDAVEHRTNGDAGPVSYSSSR
jgi:hypothetical protein